LFDPSAPPVEDGVKTAKQNCEKAHVLPHGKKNHDRKENTGDQLV